MLNNEIKNLKDRYQNGRDNIGRDFVLPCLKESVLYRRGTGFFSSSVLKAYVEIIDKVIDGDLKIEILCSPVIHDKTLIDILKRNSSDKDRKETIRRLADQIVLVAAGFSLSPEKMGYRSKLLSYLIATERLEIRFAIPKDFELLYQEGVNEEESRNLYHVKVGYFKFSNDEYVAFDGSFNESESGLQRHVDRTQVYKSWLPEDAKRVEHIREDIDADWNGDNEFINVYPISKDALKKIKELSPSTRPKKPTNIINPPKVEPCVPEIPLEDSYLWKHQEKAVKEFLKNRHGILEMATGTGKTTTALEIILRLFKEALIESVVVITYGTDLLKQWDEALNSWFAKNNVLARFGVCKAFDKNHELAHFLMNPIDKALILSRRESQIRQVLTHQNINKEKTLLIYDEVHGFGAETNLKLVGLHDKFIYKLGLSATPEREYDENGNDFIAKEIGNVIFEYPISSAIEDGILTEFDYVPLHFELTENDLEERRNVYKRKAAAEAKGEPWSDERLYQELARVVKKAELKPALLDEYLSKNSDILKYAIIYTIDNEQGHEIASVISKYTNRYATYFQGADELFLKKLGKGDIDVLIANERLNEGIDIPSVSVVILVSSDKAKLKTIQRIGRCLRVDKNNSNKRALIVDFILDTDDENAADNQRNEWLQDMSNARRKVNGT